MDNSDRSDLVLSSEGREGGWKVGGSMLEGFDHDGEWLLVVGVEGELELELELDAEETTWVSVKVDVSTSLRLPEECVDIICHSNN